MTTDDRPIDATDQPQSPQAALDDIADALRDLARDVESNEHRPSAEEICARLALIASMISQVAGALAGALTGASSATIDPSRVAASNPSSRPGERPVPGTQVVNGVRTTMDAPFPRAAATRQPEPVLTQSTAGESSAASAASAPATLAGEEPSSLGESPRDYNAPAIE